MSRRFDYVPACCDDIILSAAEASREFYGLEDANRYFSALCAENPDFSSPTNNCYRYKDYFINAGKRFLMAGHANGLMNLKGMELSCLPEYVAQIWLDNDEDMVLVTRIKGSSGSRLMPCSEAGILTESAICRLLADIERLLKSNCTVSEITEERDCWYFIENTDRVIISRCSLTYVPDEAKTAYLCRVKRLFGAE